MSTTELEIIEVPIDVLASPSKVLLLAGTNFITSLKSVEAQIASLKITDAHSNQEAATLMQRLTTAGSALESQRKTLKAPFIEMGNKIDAAAKAPAARIATAKQLLSNMQTAFAVEQQRLAREAEEKRQAELAALERQRVKEAEEEAARVAELERQAAEIAKQAESSGTTILEDEEEPPVAPPPTVVEQKIAQLQAAPAVVVPKAQGVRMKVTLEPVVTDVNALADIFITKSPKIQAIKGAYCVGWAEGQPIPVCPGVKFEVKREVQSTGKGAF